MEKNQSNENDREILLSIIEKISKSTTGQQYTKDWADNAIWFDIPPFASKGIKPACKMVDESFSKLKSFEAEILQSETFINGEMGVVCSVQRWNMVGKDGEAIPSLLVRLTHCFERHNGQWQIIHEHLSLPANPGWDGKIISDF